MFRKPFFWVGLALCAIGSVLFTFYFFADAFPIVSVDLRMDRSQAMDSAAELTRTLKLGPEPYSQAASFGVDQRVQNFVELEAGGTQAFKGLVESRLYSPFAWRVRHFREGDTHEVSFWFTPEGEPYGFSEHLDEEAAGATLTPDEARQVAETATGFWRIKLSDFSLVEQSQEVKPGGRTDHTIVYERSGNTIGEGRFRLRMTVAGDRVTEVRHFVKIPESFDRRFEEMRSSNEVISFGALIAVGGLYLLFGCGFGLFLLLRNRWALWRPAVFWGGLIGFLQFLAQLNGLPLVWMGYDTAVGAAGFLFHQVVQAFGGALLMGAVLSVSFLVAEGLTRKAFPDQIQLWKIWSPEVGSSPTVLGMTVGGILMVPVFFAYDVALYSFSTSVLGWWAPSDALIQPDTLATYFPWLNSIAISAQAGFWEESLFRAVPLAGAALLGNRFGGRKYWIGFALVLEAVVFGAGHANYPAQPAYARLVELILPALGFGLIYLRFGLLPVVVLHFIFDVCWFAIPVYVSTASGVIVDKALILLLALVPLWMVLWRRYRAGAWSVVPATTFNRAWLPSQTAEMVPESTGIDLRASFSASRLRLLAAGFLVLGVITWAWFTPFKTDAPGLKLDRAEAGQAAQLVLDQKGLQFGPEWKELVSVEAPNNENDRFVWQEGGPELYSKLLGTYLGGPYWVFRYARFEGDVAERAEEYQVHLDYEGKPFRFIHRLPEARAGATLERDQAKTLAEAEIRRSFGLDPTRLKEVSAEPSQLPSRRDWVFVFSDPDAFPLPKGEARISVDISGDEVSDSYRWIFVPEEWLREERNAGNVLSILSGICSALLSVLVLVGGILAVVYWSRHEFSARRFLHLALLLGGLSLLAVANNWPSVESRFTTAQPYLTQVLVFAVGACFVSLLVAVLVGLVYGLWSRWNQDQPSITQEFWPGLAYGVGAAGMLALFGGILPKTAPLWPDVSQAGAVFPGLAAVLGTLTGFITRSVVLGLVFTILRRLENGTRSRVALISLALFAFAVATAGSRHPSDYLSWMGGALAYSVVYLFMYWTLLRYAAACVMPAVAAASLLTLIENGVVGAFPGSAWACLAAGVGILAVVGGWKRSLFPKTKKNLQESVKVV